MLDIGAKDDVMVNLCRRPVNMRVDRVGRGRFEEVSQRLDRNVIESERTATRRS